MQFFEYLISLVSEKPLFHNSIRASRLIKEKDLCEIDNQQLKWSSSNDIDTIEFDIQENGGIIQLNQLYPFQQPTIKFQFGDDYYTVANFEDYNCYDYYFKKLKWTPSLTVIQIIKNCKILMNKAVIMKKPYSFDPYSDWCCKLRKNCGSGSVVLFMYLIIFLINLLITIPDYSNQQSLMEKTVNLGIGKWYNQFQQLPIAPLRAYFTYFVGLIVGIINQEYLFVQKSQSETVNLLFYHYLNVSLNLAFFYTPLYYILKFNSHKLNKDILSGTLFYLLACPSLIGIWNVTESKLLLQQALTLVTIVTLSQNIWAGSVAYLLLVNYEPQMIVFLPIIFSYVIGQLSLYHGLISAKTIKPNLSRIYPLLIEAIIILAVLMILQAIILLPLYYNNGLYYVFNSLLFINPECFLIDSHLLTTLAVIVIFGAIVSSVIASFLSGKYLALSFFTLANLLLIFNITTEIRMQLYSTLILLNFKYFRSFINNVIFFLPQHNPFYQILYFINGELFTRRNCQVVLQQEQRKTEQLIRFITAGQLLLHFLFYFWKPESINKLIFYITLSLVTQRCLTESFKKAEKVLKKRKTD